jgi:hypothetical protein
MPGFQENDTPNDGAVNPDDLEVPAKIAGVENDDQIAREMDEKYVCKIITSTYGLGSCTIMTIYMHIWKESSQGRYFLPTLIMMIHWRFSS